MHIRIEFDPGKSDRNETERGLPFSLIAELNWSSVQAVEDTRKPYPERRFVGVGFIGQRLHVVCFTPIGGGIRVISFRKANEREIRRYEQQAID